MRSTTSPLFFALAMSLPRSPSQICDEAPPCHVPNEQTAPPPARTLDSIASNYQRTTKDHLIQRLLLKKWSILNEIEQFLIHVSAREHQDDDTLDPCQSAPRDDKAPSPEDSALSRRPIIDASVLTLLKYQHALRTQGHQHIPIMQTSTQVDALRTLGNEELNDILHDFDTILCDIRQLIAAQHGTLIFTTIPLQDTVDQLLKGYQIISQY